MLRKHKKYSKPRKPFNKQRIEEEAIIKTKYGLKNKKEIWRAEAAVTKIRRQAKELIRAGEDEKNAFFIRLQKQGFKVKTIADVLALTKEDYLKRRLQTILVEKKMTTTSKSARQMIVHKRVLINNKAVNSPSYLVPVELESKISIKQRIKPKMEDVKISGEINNG